MMKLIGGNKFLFLIIFLAAAIRFAVIEKVPPSLNWDEISHGYNAYSILKTGKDEWGVTLPTIFRAYGDYKLPLYIYLTAISEAFFGLTTLAIRLPSILAGVATVIFTYLLTKKLFNEKAALISSLLVAVEPWSFFLSRGAFEANLSLALIVSGFYFFVEGLNKPKFLPISALLLGLSVWTYNSARIFVPLLIIVYILIYKDQLLKLRLKSKKYITYSLLVLFFFLVPMFYQLANTTGQARYSKVVIIDEGAVAQINQSRALSKYSPAVSRIIYNKGSYFVSQFSKNYFSHFSLDFLALKGGSHYQFSVPNHGLIYNINIVFLLFGILRLLKSRSKESFFV
ncbi:MAG: glycosyltransferase family 39 protein, partial [Patescibacteria group bacterium]